MGCLDKESILFLFKTVPQIMQQVKTDSGTPSTDPACPVYFSASSLHFICMDASINIGNLSKTCKS